MYQLITAWFWYRQFKAAVEDATDDMIVKELAAKVKMVRLEKVEQNGASVILVYDADNNFITQGLSESEAEILLKQKWPAHTIVAVTSEDYNNPKTIISADKY